MRPYFRQERSQLQVKYLHIQKEKVPLYPRCLHFRQDQILLHYRHLRRGDVCRNTPISRRPVDGRITP
jgi:hypothetical protein